MELLATPSWSEFAKGESALAWQRYAPRAPYRRRSADARRILAEHARDVIPEGIACIGTVRGRRRELVHFVGHTEGRLFVLDADPCGVLNLGDDPARAERRRETAEEILCWRTMTAMTPAPSPAPVL